MYKLIENYQTNTKIIKGGIQMALNCRRYDCVHNDKEGSCFAKVIAVSGANAQSTAGTTCESYVPMGDSSQNYEFATEFTGSTGSDKTSSNVQNITCEAMNCRYNYNRDCTAMVVEIDNQNARCETFQK